MTTLRVLVADDHEMVRRGLRTLIESQPGWTVCAEATTGREALELAAATMPQVIVMDISMPELNGLEATRLIRKSHPNAEVLILSMHDSEQLVREVIAAGARGYMLKTDAGELLVQAIAHVAQHKPFFTSRVSEIMLRQFTSGAPAATRESPLSPRERQILQLIAEGRSTKEVAAELGISVKTTETHRTNLMRKLDLHSVSELVRYAIRNRIVNP